MTDEDVGEDLGEAEGEGEEEEGKREEMRTRLRLIMGDFIGLLVSRPHRPGKKSQRGPF
jgi:hypothetical protein